MRKTIGKPQTNFPMKLAETWSTQMLILEIIKILITEKMFEMLETRLKVLVLLNLLMVQVKL